MNVQNKKTLRTFSIASFLNDFGSDMIAPIWPVFVTSVLGAPVAVLGLIDGIGESVVSISQAISGVISDRLRKRKIFIWLGYLCAGISRVGYALIWSWHWLIPFRVLDRAGKMRGAPRDAIIADISEKNERGGNFGLLRMMDNLGAVCGIIVSLLLFPVLGFTNLFLLAALPSLIGAILIFVRTPEVTARVASEEKKIAHPRTFSPAYRRFLGISCLFAAGSFTYSFLLLLAKKNGIPTALLPLVYLFLTAVASATSIPLGRLSDSIGRKNVMVIAIAVWILMAASMLLWQSAWIAVIAAFFFGLHNGAIDTAQRAFVSELAPAHLKATGLGTFQMLVGIASLPGSFIAGILWDTISPQAPFIYSLIMSAASLVLLAFMKSSRAT